MRKLPGAKETHFLREMARGAGPIEAARAAGYASPERSAAQNLDRPAIVAAILQIQAARLHDCLMPLASDVVEKVLRGKNETSANKLRAAKLVFDQAAALARADAADAADADGSTMTAAELRARIQERQARLAELDAELGPMVEAEALDVTPGAPSMGDMG